MKSFFILFIGIILSASFSFSCRYGSVPETKPLKVRLAEDTEATLRELEAICIAPVLNTLPDSTKNLFWEALLTFPDRPTGNKDSIARLTGEIIYQTRNTRGAFELMDSLQQTGSVFLREQCGYYLLATQAYSLSKIGDKRGMELLASFLKLPPCPDMVQDMLSCHMMSVVSQFGGNKAEEYIGLQERAVASYRQCGTDEDGIRILQRMGYYYRRSGMYEKAVEYLQEAYALFISQGPERQESYGIQLTGDLSNLYSSLQLNDKAIEMNSEAIKLSHTERSFLTDLYRMRGTIYNRSEQVDSAYYYFNRSIEEAKRTQNQAALRLGKVALAKLLIKESDKYPADSLLSARRILETLYADSVHTSPTFRVNTRFQLGEACAKMGDVARGKRLMEEAAREYVALQWDESIDFTYKQLMKLYVKEGMKNEIANLFPAYAAMRDSIQAKDKITAAIAANVRYETGRKEQENRALTAEVALKERSLVYTRMILVLSLLLLFTVAALFMQYRKMRHNERKSHQAEINRQLSALQEMNRLNEALNVKLEEAMHNETIDNVRQQLNPTMLTGENELRFRQSFAALYPRYLPKLRGRCEGITKSDELLCILVYLGQNTDEIALALGISRASVNSARSRIRKKLGLQKEESLEETLKFIG